MINKPGFAYLDGNATATYADKRLELKNAANNLKIINDAAGDLSFSINEEEDSAKVSGIVKQDEILDFTGLKISTIQVKGSGAFRLWAWE